MWNEHLCCFLLVTMINLCNCKVSVFITAQDRKSDKKRERDDRYYLIDLLIFFKDQFGHCQIYASLELSHSSICLPLCQCLCWQTDIEEDIELWSTLCQCLCWQTGRDDEGGREPRQEQFATRGETLKQGDDDDKWTQIQIQYKYRYRYKYKYKQKYNTKARQEQAEKLSSKGMMMKFGPRIQF